MSDKRFVVFSVTLLIVVGVVYAYTIFHKDTPDANVIFSGGDLEVRAVCTVDSGVIVTTIKNHIKAGDRVTTIRMTKAEYQHYCAGAEQ